MTSKAQRRESSHWRAGAGTLQSDGLEAGKVLRLGDMARSDNVIFLPPVLPKAICWKALAAKAISDYRNAADPRQVTHHSPHSVLHYLDRKDPEMQVHIL